MLGGDFLFVMMGNLSDHFLRQIENYFREHGNEDNHQHHDDEKRKCCFENILHIIASYVLDNKDRKAYRRCDL